MNLDNTARNVYFFLFYSKGDSTEAKIIKQKTKSPHVAVSRKAKYSFERPKEGDAH